MNIGEKIKYYRTAHKISGERLSELSGISISTIRKYESGERKPKPEQLLKISEALGISINTFLDLDIKTVSDLLSLIFKMDEQLDIRLEATKDETDTYDPKTLRLSFGNDAVNKKLLTYMIAQQKKEEYLSSTESPSDNHTQTIENNIMDLKNRLLDDNTIIQKNIAEADFSEARTDTIESSPTDVSNHTSSELYLLLQDILYDCSTKELELITKTAQTIKDCLRN
jgi:transcriptional regulator with XRE-family HTH domain